MEAVKIRLLPVDNAGSAIMVNISVVITLVDDDSFVTVLMITIADDVTVTVAVPVTISVTLTNRYANRADTNAHLFRASRHCAEDSSDGGDHYGILIHCVLLSLLSSAGAILRRRDRSGFRWELGENERAQDGAPMLDDGVHVVCIKAWTHFAAALVTRRRVLGLPRCFRSPGELCPEASARYACRQTAAGVGAFEFAQCYRSRRALLPSRSPLLKDKIRVAVGSRPNQATTLFYCGHNLWVHEFTSPRRTAAANPIAAHNVLKCREPKSPTCQFTTEVALDGGRKTLTGIALRAFESAHVITRCGRFDLGQPHGVAALGARKDADFSTAVECIGMGGWHDARLRSGGSVMLSVTGNCRQGAGITVSR
jgi:hypothetical protein